MYPTFIATGAADGASVAGASDAGASVAGASLAGAEEAAGLLQAPATRMTAKRIAGVVNRDKVVLLGV
jgi:hypothetical protein